MQYYAYPRSVVEMLVHELEHLRVVRTADEDTLDRVIPTLRNPIKLGERDGRGNNTRVFMTLTE